MVESRPSAPGDRRMIGTFGAGRGTHRTWTGERLVFLAALGGMFTIAASCTGERAGSLPVADAGVEPDAGSHEFDAGGLELDAGSGERPDAGVGHPPAPACDGGVATVSFSIHGARCSLKCDGTVSCFGVSGIHTLSTIADVHDAVGVAAGRGRSGTGEAVIAHADGTVSHVDSDRTERVAGLSGIVEVVAGDSHFCARNAAGEVWCWGRNGSGQVDMVVSSGEVVAPRRVALPKAAAQVVEGVFGSCILDGEGSVWCWGILSPAKSASSSPAARIPELQGAKRLVAGRSRTLGWPVRTLCRRHLPLYPPHGASRGGRGPRRL